MCNIMKVHLCGFGHDSETTKQNEKRKESLQLIDDDFEGYLSMDAVQRRILRVCKQEVYCNIYFGNIED